MKDYYKILQLNRNATQVEIKRAYRRLAMQYHPDRNPDIKSQRFFVEISEAYRILSNPERKKHYDDLLNNKHKRISYTYQTARERAQARARAYADLRKRRQEAKKEETRKYFQKHLRKTMLACLIVTIFSNLLIFDYLLPSRLVYEPVIRKYTTTLSPGSVIIETQSCRVPIGRGAIDKYIFPGHPVHLEVTPLFNTVKRVNIRSSDKIMWAPPHFSIYSVWVFTLIIIFVTSHLGLFFFKSEEQIFNLAFVSIFFSLLVLYLLYVTH